MKEKHVTKYTRSTNLLLSTDIQAIWAATDVSQKHIHVSSTSMRYIYISLIQTEFNP